MGYRTQDGQFWSSNPEVFFFPLSKFLSLVSFLGLGLVLGLGLGLGLALGLGLGLGLGFRVRVRFQSYAVVLPVDTI